MFVVCANLCSQDTTTVMLLGPWIPAFEQGGAVESYQLHTIGILSYKWYVIKLLCTTIGLVPAFCFNKKGRRKQRSSEDIKFKLHQNFLRPRKHEGWLATSSRVENFQASKLKKHASSIVVFIMLPSNFICFQINICHHKKWGDYWCK